MRANTAESEPVGAEAIFGESIQQARSYVTNLAHHGQQLGLIGPREASRLWSRHIINCALLAPFIDSGARVADVGSGAGLPGLVLAIMRPDADFVLIEPMERRADWLRAETARLALTNAMVHRARAEESAAAGPFDYVTARAVSSLKTLIPATAPLLRGGGQLIFLKGARVHDEITAATAEIRRYRLHQVEVLELGDGIVPEMTRLFRATVGEAS